MSTRYVNPLQCKKQKAFYSRARGGFGKLYSIQMSPCHTQVTERRHGKFAVSADDNKIALLGDGALQRSFAPSPSKAIVLSEQRGGFTKTFDKNTSAQ